MRIEVTKFCQNGNADARAVAILSEKKRPSQIDTADSAEEEI